MQDSTKISPEAEQAADDIVGLLDQVGPVKWKAVALRVQRVLDEQASDFLYERIRETQKNWPPPFNPDVES